MSEIIEKYKTIKSVSEGSYKEKGSKFIAFAYPVSKEEEIKDIQQDLRKNYYDARHHVFAWRLGADKKRYRSSDDGEPSNSSGPPVLGQIQSFDLTNILIVVIRYFGGTKLGVPGLINAYRTSAKDAIENNVIIEEIVKSNYILKFSYNEMNSVMKLIKDNNINQLNQNFDLNCSLEIEINVKDEEIVIEKLKKINGVKINKILNK
jgi:uncharacterized YigZ family protein